MISTLSSTLHIRLEWLDISFSMLIKFVHRLTALLTLHIDLKLPSLCHHFLHQPCIYPPYCVINFVYPLTVSLIMSIPLKCFWSSSISLLTMFHATDGLSTTNNNYVPLFLTRLYVPSLFRSIGSFASSCVRPVPFVSCLPIDRSPWCIRVPAVFPCDAFLLYWLFSLARLLLTPFSDSRVYYYPLSMPPAVSYPPFFSDALSSCRILVLMHLSLVHFLRYNFQSLIFDGPIFLRSISSTELAITYLWRTSPPVPLHFSHFLLSLLYSGALISYSLLLLSLIDNFTGKLLSQSSILSKTCHLSGFFFWFLDSNTVQWVRFNQHNS